MADVSPDFDDDAWISFVRGVLPAPDANLMRAHLDRRCVACQPTHQTWKRFVETVSPDVPDVPAESANRSIKALFTLMRCIPFSAGVALLAKRVFDSSLDPSPVGIRGSSVSARQLQYEAGDYLIDLQLERRTGGAGTLVGQVVHAWREGASCGAGVVLLQEGAVVGQTCANSLGEFQFDFAHRDNLRIGLGIPDGVLIDVPLSDVGEVASVIWNIQGLVITITISGRANDHLRGAIIQAMSSPEFPRMPAVVMDMRYATENPTPDQLRLRAGWIATLLSRRSGSRCALVVGARPHHYGLARILSVCLETEGIQTEVFTNISEAKRWLTPARGRKGHDCASG